MYVSSILCYDTNDLNLDKTFINSDFELLKMIPI